MRPLILLALAATLTGCAAPRVAGYRAVPKSATIGLPEWIAQLSITYEFVGEGSGEPAVAPSVIAEQ